MKLRKILNENSLEVLDKIKIGSITVPNISDWKKNPSDFTFACQAATKYVQKFHKNMFVVPGNSYGRRVFHIIQEHESLSKFVAGSKGSPVKAAMVDIDLNVYSVILTEN